MLIFGGKESFADSAFQTGFLKYLECGELILGHNLKT